MGKSIPFFEFINGKDCQIAKSFGDAGNGHICTNLHMNMRYLRLFNLDP